jgi:Xaa-Pro aminopeptidase
MNNENAEVATDKPKRIHDQAPSELFANFMKSGWSPSEFNQYCSP